MLRCASVVYQCIETPIDDDEEEEEDFEAEPQPEMSGMTMLGRTESDAVRKDAPSDERRPLGAGENMLHIVMMTDDWDQSLTLHFFMVRPLHLRMLRNSQRTRSFTRL